MRDLRNVSFVALTVSLSVLGSACGGYDPDDPNAEQEAADLLEYAGPSCDARANKSMCWEFVGELYGSTIDLHPAAACDNEEGVLINDACPLDDAVGTCIVNGDTSGEARFVFYSVGGSDNAEGDDPFPPYTAAHAEQLCAGMHGEFVPAG